MGPLRWRADVVKLDRRELLQSGGLAAALALAPATAWSQPYPSRPVRLVVGFAASGGNDIVARLIGQWLSDRLGQPFVIDNRPGGGGNVATEAVINAPPDGHTLLLVSAANAINATLFDKLSFNFIADVAAVSGLMRVPSVIVLHPSVQVRTVPELIAYAKLNGGKLTMASGGTGTSTHLAGELFKMMAGVDMVHVPYRGTALAITDLLGGQVQVMFASAPSAMEFIKRGALRAVAVTTAARLEALPDVPTVGETIAGYEAAQWYGIGAPKATPREIVDLLSKEINAALDDPKMLARFAELGGTPLRGSAAEFGQLVAVETAKWAKVVKFSQAKPY
ncbi:MAG: tripartite tricarboxylate transporter substrate binding protein [Hyphomicrobiales bacterium]|nr:tripartite tricarboxylate transporter substrate binding protein [Hyphomicrobiales bacterium]